MERELRITNGLLLKWRDRHQVQYRQRLHSSLGYLSPAAFERQYVDEIEAVR